MVSTFKEANHGSIYHGEILNSESAEDDNSSDTEEIEIDSILKNKENAGVIKK